MSAILEYLGNVTVKETLETGVPAASANKRIVTHDLFNTAKTLNVDSTPPVTKVANFEQALTVGAATIDLTSLAGTNGASIDGTGLRVQMLKLRNKDANNPVTIEEGASNGYDGFGSGFSVTIAEEGEVTLLTNDAGTDIGATNKTLDLSGTGSEEVEVSIVMG